MGEETLLEAVRKLREGLYKISSAWQFRFRSVADFASPLRFVNDVIHAYDSPAGADASRSREVKEG